MVYIHLIIAMFFSLVGSTYAQEMVYDEFHKNNTYSAIKIKYTQDIASSLRFFHNGEMRAHDDVLGELLSITSEFMLINACISNENGLPIGFFRDSSKTILPVNLADGEGNFYLKPNGALLLNSSEPIICVSEEILVHKDAIFGIQSGPMLVIKGAIHSKFSAGSASKYIRCGVGISKKSNGANLLVFAISNAPVTLYEFADYFLSSLGCSDALVLGSQGCSMYIPGRPSDKTTYPGVISNYLFLKL